MAGILSRARRLSADLLDFFYPRACLVCNSPPLLDAPLCAPCRSDLARLPHPVCPRCRFFATHGENACPLRHRTQPELVWSLGLFDDYYRTLILALKFHERRDCGKFLGDRLADVIAADPRSRNIDCVVPVPLHRARRRERGYNQSEILAAPIARRLQRPHLPRGLRRTRNTRAQRLLNREARRANVEFAFASGGDDSVAGTVLLVDDVLTTGATLTACASVLRAGGATRVLAAVAALAEYGAEASPGVRQAA